MNEAANEFIQQPDQNETSLIHGSNTQLQQTQILEQFADDVRAFEI